MGVSLICPQTLICPRILPAASSGRKKTFSFQFSWRKPLERGAGLCYALPHLHWFGDFAMSRVLHDSRGCSSRQSIPRVTEDPNRIPRVTEDPDHTRAFPE